MTKSSIFSFIAKLLFTVLIHAVNNRGVFCLSSEYVNRFDEFKASICDLAKRRTNLHVIEDGCSFNSSLQPAMDYLSEYLERYALRIFALAVFSAAAFRKENLP